MSERLAELERLAKAAMADWSPGVGWRDSANIFDFDCASTPETFLELVAEIRRLRARLRALLEGDDTQLVECPWCRGRGGESLINCRFPLVGRQRHYWVMCTACNGEGRVSAAYAAQERPRQVPDG